MTGTKTYRKLSPEKLASIARQFTTRRAFYEGDPSAYVSAKRKGILDDVCAHMFTGRFKWTKAMILSAAKRYKTRTEFAKGNKAAYSAAARHGILDEACAHMPKYVSKKQKELEAAE